MASVKPVVRATFKRPAQPHPPHARQSSPESPAFEPLSPPRPVEPTFNYPPLAQPKSRLQSTSSKPPPQSQNGRTHHRSPSTIEALADAALSTSPQPPHRPSPAQYPNPDSARAAKRARSDAGPLPQPYPFAGRPASSHHLSDTNGFPLAHNVDRQRRQSTNTTVQSSTNPLEDAELLLNFASRVAPRPVVGEAPSQPAVLAPSALPPPPPPTYPAFVSAPGQPYQSASFPPENPSASLPSPQGTNEDDKSLEKETDKDVTQIPALSSQSSDHVRPPTIAVPEPQDIHAPQQTHTPPEEERIISDVSGAGPTMASRKDGTEPQTVQAADPQQASEVPAARPRRGWPKGKPRGPRNKTSTAAKPRSSTRRSRASTAKSNTESCDSSAEEKRIRRKSDSDLRTFNASLSLSRQVDARGVSVPPGVRFEILPPRPKSAGLRRVTKEVVHETVCASCSQTRESNHGELDQWISCNGCKQWFHFDCAGFKNERDVRDVDKFFCKPCEPQFGPTTFVRKSSRAHAAVDYAGLNQGILKTSDDNPEHHYIQPIKDGSFTFDPETFPRMRPELVTRNFFETCTSFSEPVVIPAEFNPKLPTAPSDDDMEVDDAKTSGFCNGQEEEALTRHFEYETVTNDGQDRLDMVVPRGLTVRHVAQLVGPDEPLEVIDVKTQGTEGKWNLQKWADYYEADGEKAVRNVISLEVSATKLGRLLRRPKIVRDIDLQDSVWPEEEIAKGNYPKVQFYCLMSVADSFTDFHIDFGGSSVYYHILRGKKTFFFIPPKPSHLKKYEDWNNSHEQNFTWLPDATKECYRVDLSEGDTMLIPSGWIHAVWTPDNSLVIGGNFLTRMHYSTQFRVVDIEKAIKTPQKFRYPHFQKVMWYSVIKYLETDPLPAEVAQVFYNGDKFVRQRPIWQEFDQHGSESEHSPGTPGYNTRYYSQAELDGLPELIRFIFRTVMISLGKVEGVTEDTRKKVLRSIPKSHGEPLELAKTFALWVAWKRGNEDPPAWAHPDADLPDSESAAPKKLSARALKLMQRQEAFDAYRIAPDRQSARQQASREANSVTATSPVPSVQPQPSQTPTAQYTQHTSTPKTSVLGPKRVACDACRKRRIKCKHKDVVTTTTPTGPPAMLLQSTSSIEGTDTLPTEVQRGASRELFANSGDTIVNTAEQPDQTVGVAPIAQMTATADGNGPALVPGNALLADPSSKRGRSKACLDCRKSKRRCIHDENGKIDPVKAEQTPVPRGSAASKKRRISGEMESPSKKTSQQVRPLQNISGMPFSMSAAYQPNMISPQQYKPIPYQDANIPHWQHSNYMYPDPTDADGNIVVSGGPYHQQADLHNPYNAQSLEQLANEVLDSRFVNDGDYTVPQPSGDAAIHPALQHASVSHPDISQVQQQVSPLLERARPHVGSNNVPNGVHVAAEPAIARNGSQHRPSSSSELLQGPKLDSLGSQVSLAPPVSAATTAPQTNDLSVEQHAETSVMPNKQPSENAVNGPASIAREPAVTPASQNIGSEQPEQVEKLPKEASSPLSAAPKTGLNNIPLYEPPPLVVNRQPSRAPQKSASGNAETPARSSRRSLSRTPAPPVQTIEQKTPGSRKRKRESTSATPSTAKSKKMEHIAREMSVVEEEEEKSLRLARELQDQDWGLRRRSSRNSSETGRGDSAPTVPPPLQIAVSGSLSSAQQYTTVTLTTTEYTTVAYSAHSSQPTGYPASTYEFLSTSDTPAGPPTTTSEISSATTSTSTTSATSKSKSYSTTTVHTTRFYTSTLTIIQTPVVTTTVNPTSTSTSVSSSSAVAASNGSGAGFISKGPVSKHSAVVAGSVTGAVAGLAMIGLVLLLLSRHWKRRPATAESPPTMHISSPLPPSYRESICPAAQPQGGLPIIENNLIHMDLDHWDRPTVYSTPREHASPLRLMNPDLPAPSTPPTITGPIPPATTTTATSASPHTFLQRQRSALAAALLSMKRSFSSQSIPTTTGATQSRSTPEKSERRRHLTMPSESFFANFHSGAVINAPPDRNSHIENSNTEDPSAPPSRSSTQTIIRHQMPEDPFYTPIYVDPELGLLAPPPLCVGRPLHLQPFRPLPQQQQPVSSTQPPSHPQHPQQFSYGRNLVPRPGAQSVSPLSASLSRGSEGRHSRSSNGTTITRFEFDSGSGTATPSMLSHSQSQRSHSQRSYNSHRSTRSEEGASVRSGPFDLATPSFVRSGLSVGAAGARDGNGDIGVAVSRDSPVLAHTDTDMGVGVDRGRGREATPNWVVHTYTGT